MRRLRGRIGVWALAHAGGGLQLVFAGKAHPHDDPGQALIRAVVHQRTALAPDVGVVGLPDYDLDLARARSISAITSPPRSRMTAAASSVSSTTIAAAIVP